jgi:putative flippase GtrA
VPRLLRLEGERYEYEMNVLADAAVSCGIAEVPIETVYIDGNRSSHFNPVWDSMRVYFVLVRFYLSSLISSSIDFVVFTVVFWSTSNLLASVIAGRVSSLANFFLNRSFVFSNQGGMASALGKYYALAAVMALASYSGIHFLSEVFGKNVLMAKVLVETLLSLVSFSIQRTFIFRSKEKV